MMFKNAINFRLNSGFDFTEALSERLEVFHQFQECGEQQPASIGFVPVLKSSQDLYFQHEEFCLFKLQKQERILPASVVRDEVQQHVDRIEQQEGRKVLPKEKRTIKDEVTFKLLPKAFKKNQFIYVLINTKENLVMVDCAAVGTADEITSFFRESLGSLPMIGLSNGLNIPFTLSDWILKEETPDGWDIMEGSSVVLETAGKAKLSTKSSGPDGIGAVQKMIMSESQYRCIRTAFNFNERLAGFVDKKCSIKSIRLSDALIEQAMESQEDLEQVEIATFILFANEITAVLKSCMEVFNGVD
jgi:recombination associated protein RdgC